MKKEKNQKILLLLIFIFGIGYVYYSYLFVPEWNVIKTSKAQLLERQGYHQRLVNYSANVAEIDKEILTLEAQQKLLISQTGSKLDKPQLFVYLNTLIKQSQLEPDKVVFGQAQDKGTYQELPLTLTFSGKVNDVLNLIKNLQFSGTQRFAIQNTKLTDKQGSLDVELKLTVYIAVLPGIGTAPGPIPPYMIYPFGAGTISQIFKQ